MIWEIKDPNKLHAERRRAELTSFLLQPHPGDIVVDIGCGDGYQISHIAGSESLIIGIDLSLLKLKNGKKRLKHVEFLRACSDKLPFRRQIFDKVMCLELLEHVENPSKTLYEIDLVLKKGGILVISVPYREEIAMTQCIYCNRLTPISGHLHSFDEDKVTSILPNNYVSLRHEYFGTILASYILFSPLPLRIWRIIDRLCALFPAVRPSWFLNKVQKMR